MILLVLLGKTGNDFFSLRINDGTPVRQYYSGDLQCFPDLGTLVMINNCNVESYIAGVVKAEGGTAGIRSISKPRQYLPGHTCTSISISICQTGIMYVTIHIVRHLTDYHQIQL